MKYFIILIFLIFNTVNIKSQDLKITYQLKYKAIKNNDSISTELFDLSILTKLNKSYFFSYSKTISDSLYTEIGKSTHSERNRLLQLVPDYSYKTIIEKNTLNQSMLVYEKFDNQYYSYPQGKLQKYKLQNDKKTVLGYKCKNATIELGERKWEVWYSTQLPFNDGPYKFFGLPGLILEVNSFDGDFNFSAVGISKTISSLIMPKNIIKLNAQGEIIILKKKYIKNPSSKSRLEDFASGISGISIVNGVKYSSEDSYKILDNELWNWMKNNNNPIEINDINVL